MNKFGQKLETPISALTVRVRIERGELLNAEFVFTQTFRIGRDESCHVRIQDSAVSRIHAEVFFEKGRWWVRDLNSSNGIYIAGGKIERAPLDEKTKLQLGIAGPVVSLEIESGVKARPSTPGDHPSMTHYIQRYFDDKLTDGIGEHTMMVRRAFHQIQKKRSQKYLVIIASVSVLCLGALVYALYKHNQLLKQQALAQELFYEMKSLELTLARLEKSVAMAGDPKAQAELTQYRAKRKELEKSYEQFVDELGIYDKKMNEDERIIFRIARIYGECEINMPEGLVEEVRSYIGKWQSTNRLRKAMTRAEENGYAAKIVEAMLAQDMPPQFFFLALQESNFNLNTCGPETRYGIAKGMWQFIPATAMTYGLRTGPLVHLRRPDPRDERHDFDKSTKAAASYLKYIYDTEAQASGLLVIASYNWGEDKVRALIRRMPENPRERNFWQLLEKHRSNLPQETYDYVFYIISAAVIGENPRLFGFDFENPLRK